MFDAVCIEQNPTPKSKGENNMATTNTELLTASNIAKQLKVSDVKVKKAIKELGVKPAAKKGVCCYYSADVIAKVKANIK
jgi:hypothetical protein